jgi:hypothetical protein
MGCNFPIEAYQPPGGGRLIFNRKYGQKQGLNRIDVPCNNCMGCKMDYTRQWAMRCTHEASLHEDNAFITLTYDEEHVPSDGSLDHSHFQKFFKRLRRSLPPDYPPVKYYMCGEYGDVQPGWPHKELGRPHYHALVFGYDWPDKELFGTRGGYEIFGSELLAHQWQLGHVELGTVTFESACYTAGYVSKKLKRSHYGYNDRYNTRDTLTGELAVRSPEYCQMSRGGKKRQKDGTVTSTGGIGKEWFDKYRGDLDKDFITMRGQRMRPPKYYDRLEREEDADKFQLKLDNRFLENMAGEPIDLKTGYRIEKCQKTRFDKRSKRAKQ